MANPSLQTKNDGTLLNGGLFFALIVQVWRQDLQNVAHIHRPEKDLHEKAVKSRE